MAQLNISDYTQNDLTKFKSDLAFSKNYKPKQDFSENLANLKKSTADKKEATLPAQKLNSVAETTKADTKNASKANNEAASKVNAPNKPADDANKSSDSNKKTANTSKQDSSSVAKGKQDSAKATQEQTNKTKNATKSTKKSTDNISAQEDKRPVALTDDKTKNADTDAEVANDKKDLLSKHKLADTTEKLLDDTVKEADLNAKTTTNEQLLNLNEDEANLAVSATDDNSLSASADINLAKVGEKDFDFAKFFADKELNLENFRQAVQNLDISQELKDKLLSLTDADLKSVLETLRELFNMEDAQKLTELFDKLQKIFVELAIKLDGKDIKNFKQDVLNLTKEVAPLLADKIRKMFAMMPRQLNAGADGQKEIEGLIKNLLDGQRQVALNNQAQTQGRAPTSNLSASGDLNLELEAGLSRLVQDKLAEEKVLSKQELNMQAQKILEAKGLESLNSLLRTARSGIDFLSTNSLSANPSGLASAARGANLPSLSIFNQAGSFNSEALMARINMMQSRNLKVADLRLDPPELGSVKVRIRLHNEQTSIHFQSAHPQVREILEQNLPRLREMLQDAGVDIADAGVSDDESVGQNSQTSPDSETNKRNNSALVSSEEDIKTDENSQKDTNIELNSLIDYYA